MILEPGSPVRTRRSSAAKGPHCTRTETKYNLEKNPHRAIRKVCDTDLTVSGSLNIVKIAGILCPKEIGPLDYHAKIEEMIPNLQMSKPGQLNFDNVPSLRSVTYYNSDEDFGGVFKFDELLEAGGSNELNIIKGLKIE